MRSPSDETSFFKTPAASRAWLERHHRPESELLVGFYKVATGKPSITWKESVDEALSFGWIDGVRKSIDDERFTIRFTPRQATSIWSAVNIKRIGELIAEDRVVRAGLDAFAKRDEKRCAIYGDERGYTELDASSLEALKADEGGWHFYDAPSPYYRRMTAHWIGGAKRPETHARRLEELMVCSRRGERIPALASSTAKKTKLGKR
jgi:uncharacterized protein YdeI (YjbR/CyaY-like superfamily)